MLVNQWRERFHSTELESSGISLRDQIAKQVDRREQKLQQIQGRMAQKQADIDSLESRQLNYPGFVRQALEAIRRECPQADPRVLADYVEITDPQWQSAIEVILAQVEECALCQLCDSRNRTGQLVVVEPPDTEVTISMEKT